MKRLIALGVCLIVGAELLVLIVHDRAFVLVASGLALATVLLDVRRLLGRGIEPRPTRTPTISGIRCAAGLPPPRRRFAGPSPPGRTGIGICVRCSPVGTKSRRANDWPRTRRHSNRPAACCSAPNCGNGSIPTTSDAPQTTSPPGRAAFEEILRKLEQV